MNGWAEAAAAGRIPAAYGLASSSFTAFAPTRAIPSLASAAVACFPITRYSPTPKFPREAREKLQQSLVLVHGGMAQDVGPILEMVTEKYLLRSETEWLGRRQAIEILDEITGSSCSGATSAPSALRLQRNFDGPIQTIIPWAANLYTNTLIERARKEFGDDFWGFWMLGGMSGGGMGFLFSPERKAAGSDAHAGHHERDPSPNGAQRSVCHGAGGLRFRHQRARERRPRFIPGRCPDAPRLLHACRYLRSFAPRCPGSRPVRRAELERFTAACRSKADYAGMIQTLFDHMLPAGQRCRRRSDAHRCKTLLDNYGFDHLQHEQIRQDLRSGRIGLAQNRLPATSLIEDAEADQVDR